MTGVAAVAAPSVTERVFDLCVVALQVGARAFGTTYKAINVWIFCVLWPLATVGLIALAWRQRCELQRLRGAAPPPSASP